MQDEEQAESWMTWVVVIESLVRTSYITSLSW